MSPEMPVNIERLDIESAPGKFMLSIIINHELGQVFTTYATNITPDDFLSAAAGLYPGQPHTVEHWDTRLEKTDEVSKAVVLKVKTRKTEFIYDRSDTKPVLGVRLKSPSRIDTAVDFIAQTASEPKDKGQVAQGFAEAFAKLSKVK